MALASTTETLIGPILVGAVVNSFVFGICMLQYFEYFASGYKDDWKLVALLLWVLVIDIFQSGAAVAIVWDYAVTNFANVAALGSSPWMYASLPIFSTLAAVPIQHFMAWRIMRFSKSPVLFIYVSLLSLTQGALGCASATMGLLSPSIASHVKIIPIADAWLAMSVACDMSITALLLFFLWKSRTGFKRTDSVITRLCRTTIEAAVPVSILCILDLVFLTTNPFTNLHFMCAMPVGRLYTNTLLTTLNAREGLRRTMESSVHNSIQLGSRDMRSRYGPGRGTEVHVNVEQEVALDNFKDNQTVTQGSGEDTYVVTPSSDIKGSLA